MSGLVDLFKLISAGVYVVGVSDPNRRNAFTAAWVMQASFSPLLVVFSINPSHLSYRILASSRECSINVLKQDQMDYAKHFGREGLSDKMNLGDWQSSKMGVPYLNDSLAFFDCKVSHFSPAGDHELVVCEVVDGSILNQGSPLLYSATGDMDGSQAMYPQAWPNKA